MLIGRRGFIGGLAATLFCAPAIVRASSLMPVKPMEWPWIIPPLIEGYIGNDMWGYWACNVRGNDWSVPPSGETYERRSFFPMRAEQDDRIQAMRPRREGEFDTMVARTVVPSDVGDRWERLKAREAGQAYRPLTYDSDWWIGGDKRVYK